MYMANVEIKRVAMDATPIYHVITDFTWHSRIAFVMVMPLKRLVTYIRVAYNNVYRRILGYSRRDSASNMFVTNRIDNFDTLIHW